MSEPSRVLNYHRDRLPAGTVYIGHRWRHLPAAPTLGWLP